MYQSHVFMLHILESPGSGSTTRRVFPRSGTRTVIVWEPKEWLGCANGEEGEGEAKHGKRQS